MMTEAPKNTIYPAMFKQVRNTKSPVVDACPSTSANETTRASTPQTPIVAATLTLTGLIASFYVGGWHYCPPPVSLPSALRPRDHCDVGTLHPKTQPAHPRHQS